ncbi:cold shock domain-containing protein C2 [Huso huso]|uniref:Cold shock domain-containing protein C2 n=1 Tax=Huso huso TaxID=61971 RepID=A0ABR0YGH8_HUSHU
MCFLFTTLPRSLRQKVEWNSASPFQSSYDSSSAKGHTAMGDPELSSPTQPLSSPRSPLSLPFGFLREGSRVWERGQPHFRGELPSPLATKRTRTYSASARAAAGSLCRGHCKHFSSLSLSLSLSHIEGEYVPIEGDEVTYKVCSVPPKNQKIQAVEVVITHLAPGTKHETWTGRVISA